MRISRLALPDVLLLQSTVHADDRGTFTEVFHREKFAELGLPTDFAQDNHSRSVAGVVRGLHYQLRDPQGKLVRAVTGRIFDVAVDLRRNSAHFGRWVGVELAAGDGRQLWIPAGFAHGFCVLSDSADVSYKCTTVYDADSDRAVRWDDPEIGVEWPPATVEAPFKARGLSPKDANAPLLAMAQCFP